MALVLFAGAATAQDPVPLYPENYKATPHVKASFERRKNKNWMTEITTWKRVSDGPPM